MTHTEQLRRALRAYDLAGPETPERAAALAAVLSAAHGVCYEPTEPALEGWPGTPAPELPTPLQIEAANLRRQLRDAQEALERARYSPAEHWT